MIEARESGSVMKGEKTLGPACKRGRIRLSRLSVDVGVVDKVCAEGMGKVICCICFHSVGVALPLYSSDPCWASTQMLLRKIPGITQCRSSWEKLSS